MDIALGLEIAVALALVFAALLPLIRVMIAPVFWRSFPRYAVYATAIVTTGLLGVLLAGVLAPPLHRLALIAAGVFLVFEHWRNRPNFGRYRKLPPGSLKRFPQGFWDDHLFFLHNAYRHGPVFKTSHFIHPMVCIADLEKSISFLNEHDQFLIKPPMKFDKVVPGGFLCFMSGDSHRRYRPIIAHAVSKGVVDRLMPNIRLYLAEKSKSIVENPAFSKGSSSPLPVLEALVFDLWLQLFFGIDASTREATELRELYRLIAIKQLDSTSVDQGKSHVKRIVSIVESEVNDRDPGDRTDAFIDQVDFTKLDTHQRQVVMGNLAYLLYASSADVSSLLFWLLKMLSDNDVWLSRLGSLTVEVDRSREAKELARRIVLETLRMEQSEYLYRRAHKALTIDNIVIPEGWLIRICIREAHRHRDLVERADQFDPDRFLTWNPTPTQYRPFGGTLHACPAAHLVLTVATEAILALTTHCSWHVLADGPRELNEWMHWCPSSRFRLQLTPR